MPPYPGRPRSRAPLPPLPAPVLGEVDYWCRKLLGIGVRMTFVGDLAAGAYRLVGPVLDLDLGFVDAAVVATCEALGEPKVVTLDRRHFSVVRPRHVPFLRVLPG